MRSMGRLYCDALANTFRRVGITCGRFAAWSAEWASGEVHYCRYHAGHRKREKSLKNWRRCS